METVARSLSILLTLIFAEYVLGLLTGKNRYHGKELGANLTIIVVNRLLRLLLAGWAVGVLAVGSELAPVRWRPNLLSFLATFTAVDFFYYWYHRLTHGNRVLWAFHEVHHSSLWFNLSTAGRLSWFAPLIVPFFFLPVAVAGLPPSMIAGALALNLFYQFFLHTAWIGPLGALEGWINTPSAHRVHHSCRGSHVDRNFGGVFLVWDKLFGTYAAETERPRFGIPEGFRGHNPIRLQMEPFVRLARSLWRERAAAKRVAFRRRDAPLRH